MSNWRERIDVRDPERKIGETPDGKPIFLDVRDLIASPDDDAERLSKTIENRRSKLVNEVAYLVLKNAALFIEETFWNTAGKQGQRIYGTKTPDVAHQWVVSHGFEAIQDGLKTVVKHNGKVIRDMDAHIPVALEADVAKRVREIVKQQPTMKYG